MFNNPIYKFLEGNRMQKEINEKLSSCKTKKERRDTALSLLTNPIDRYIVEKWPEYTQLVVTIL